MALLSRSTTVLLAIAALMGALLTAAPSVGAQAAGTLSTNHELVGTTGPAVDGWFSGPVEVHLTATPGEGGEIARTEVSVDGGPWRDVDNPTETIFDGTQESFDRWRMAPGGQFQLLPDGTMLTTGGLGMLWYPVRDYGDMELTLEWRDAKPDRPAGMSAGPFTSGSNAGVFVRFPDVDKAVQDRPEDRPACQGSENRPAWVAIRCGHEIQINDRIDGDPKKTGSVYNFADIGLDQARPSARGAWNTYSVKTVGAGDYEITVTRNGEQINQWANTPGQQAARAGDPGTSERQFDRGFIGLQNHGFEDYVMFRNVRVTDLEALEPIVVRADGEHTVQYRSTDTAGTVEPVRTTHFRIDSGAPAVTVAETGADNIVLQADDTTTGAGVAAIQTRIDGGDWVSHDPAQVLFDGSQESLDRWTMSGPGSFSVTGEDGAMVTKGGLGMLWWPEDEFGDVAFTLEWREGRDDQINSNGGVFIRFPDPEEGVNYTTTDDKHACQTGLGLFLAEWVAINCGHEIQINDGNVDPKQTGSVYNFKDLNGPRATFPTEFGEWNRYEVRTVGDGSYDVTVVRNGNVLNRFTNSPGQTPARAFDPPTDVRQFAQGHIGLQNHGSADTLEYRNVRALRLDGVQTSITAPAGATVEYRAVDRAGNVSPTSTAVVG